MVGCGEKKHVPLEIDWVTFEDDIIRHDDAVDIEFSRHGFIEITLKSDRINLERHHDVAESPEPQYSLKTPSGDFEKRLSSLYLAY